MNRENQQRAAPRPIYAYCQDPAPGAWHGVWHIAATAAAATLCGRPGWQRWARRESGEPPHEVMCGHCVGQLPRLLGREQD